MYAFKSMGGSFPAEFTLRFESKEGGTEVSSRGEIEFSGLMKLVEWLFGKQIEGQVECQGLEILRFVAVLAYPPSAISCSSTPSSSRSPSQDAAGITR